MIARRRPDSPPASLHYIDRRDGSLQTEVVLGDAMVRYVYGRLAGRLLRRSILTRPWFSKAYGQWQSSGASRPAISKVIRDLCIAMDDFEVPAEGFASFNDFFTRHLRPGARCIDPDAKRLVAPADGRALVFSPLAGDTLLPVKGRSISLTRLLGSAAEAQRFAGGSAVIVRLCPSDYHRYHFPCAGTASSSHTLPGPLESVNPVALARGRAILDHNQRDRTWIDSEHLGRVAYVEVGALCVGKIVQTFVPGPVKAGLEKGYFAFGGSTVILVCEPGRVRFDEDLLTTTQRGYETLVRMGEGIGRTTSD